MAQLLSSSLRAAESPFLEVVSLRPQLARSDPGKTVSGSGFFAAGQGVSRQEAWQIVGSLQAWTADKTPLAEADSGAKRRPCG
jgi:hypothetical protein